MIIRLFLSTLLVTVLLPLNSYAWDLTRNFNSGKIGDNADHVPDGFDEAGGYSFYSDEQVAEGRAAAILNTVNGSPGWARWGGVIKFPTKLYAGDELWFQIWLYVPSDFQLTTDQGSLKFIRFKGTRADGDGDGMIDIQLRDQGSGKEAFRMLREGAIDDGWIYFGNSSDFKRDKWHKFNVHVVVDHIAQSNGGRSFVRVWFNDELVVDARSMRTLASEGAYLDYLYLFTYWNGGAPKAQHLWVDDIRIASKQPEWANSFLADSDSRPLPPAAKVTVRAGG